MSAGSAPLRPLVAMLPHVDQQSLGMLLTDSFQSRHEEEERTSYASIQLQRKGALAVDDTPKLAAACVFLLRQGNRPGITAGDLSGRLGPFGFEDAHIQGILDVLLWIEAQRPKEEVKADAAPEKTNSAADEKMNALFSLMGSDSDSDEDDAVASDWRQGDWLTDAAVASADEDEEDDDEDTVDIGEKDKVEGADIVSGRVGRVVASADAQQLGVLLHGLQYHRTRRVVEDEDLQKLKKVAAECECPLRDIFAHLGRFIDESFMFSPENQSQVKKALGPKNFEVFKTAINAVRPLQRELAQQDPLKAAHTSSAGDWFSMKMVLPNQEEGAATWSRKWVQLENGVLQIYETPKHVGSATNFVSLIPLNVCYVRAEPEEAHQSDDNPQYAFQLDIINGDDIKGEYPDKIILAAAVFEGPYESERWFDRIMFQRALYRKIPAQEPASEKAAQQLATGHPPPPEMEGWLSVEIDEPETDGQTEEEEVDKGPWPRRWVSVQAGWVCVADSPDFAAVGHFTCEIPIEGCIVTAQPKRIRRDAQFAFRMDVVSAHKEKVRGHERRTKLVIDPIDTGSRGRWLSQLSSSVTRATKHSGWLRLEEKKNQFAKLWFVLSSGKLEIYPSDTSERQDRVALILLDTVLISPTPKSKRADAEFAFRLDVEDSSRVFGKPLTKLVLDPETEENKLIWVSVLQRVSAAADSMATMVYSFVLPSTKVRAPDFCFGMTLGDDNVVDGFCEVVDGEPSPAKEAGVQSFQRVLEANGELVNDKKSLLALLEILPKGAEVELIVQEASAVAAGGGRSAAHLDAALGKKQKFSTLRRKSISMAQGIAGHNGPSADRVDVQSRRASVQNSSDNRVFEVDAPHLGKKHKKVQMRIGGHEIAFFQKHGQQIGVIDYSDVLKWGCYNSKIQIILKDFEGQESTIDCKTKIEGLPNQISNALTETMTLYRQRSRSSRASVMAKGSAIPELPSFDEAAEEDAAELDTLAEGAEDKAEGAAEEEAEVEEEEEAAEAERGSQPEPAPEPEPEPSGEPAAETDN